MIQYAGRPKAGSVVSVAAGDRAGGGAVVHREELLGIGDALGDGLALDLDDVVVGRELHVVADADRRDDDAQLDRDLPADHADAVEQIAALGSRRRASPGRSRPPAPSCRRRAASRPFPAPSSAAFSLLLRRRGARRPASRCASACTPARRSRCPGSSSGSLGRPVSDISTRNTAAMISALRLGEELASISSPRFLRLLVRVTIRPAASETMNAGTWLTRPSPIVSLV